MGGAGAHRFGMIASLARPGGNVTGLSLMSVDLSAKRLSLLKELVPGLARVGVIYDPALPSQGYIANFRQAAETLGLSLRTVEVATPEAIADEVADRYARTFAPALALLMERTDSHGVMVRPRAGRTEVCGEFIEGDRLAAVTAFAAGSVRATVEAVSRGDTRALPPKIAVAIGFTSDAFASARSSCPSSATLQSIVVKRTSRPAAAQRAAWIVRARCSRPVPGGPKTTVFARPSADSRAKSRARCGRS